MSLSTNKVPRVRFNEFQITTNHKMGIISTNWTVYYLVCINYFLVSRFECSSIFESINLCMSASDVVCKIHWWKIREIVHKWKNMKNMKKRKWNSLNIQKIKLRVFIFKCVVVLLRRTHTIFIYLWQEKTFERYIYFTMIGAVWALSTIRGLTAREYSQMIGWNNKNLAHTQCAHTHSEMLA